MDTGCKMRWSYKTVHFSLKKDGLLGSAFIDENEIEVTLNDYGKLGWELVSFMEVNDGLIAVFKQPFGAELPVLSEENTKESEVALHEAELPIRQQIEPISPEVSNEPSPVAASLAGDGEVSTISPMDNSIPEELHGTNTSEEEADTDVGSIRIL